MHHNATSQTQSEYDQTQSQNGPDSESVLSKAKQAVNETVGDSMDEAKEQVRSTLAEQKTRAASQLEQVAGALRQTSRELSTNDQSNIAQYADVAAEQVERVSGYLKEREFGELWRDIQTVAQRQPELFVAGALAAGFLVGRFLKSSSSGGQRQYSRDYYGGYTSDYTRNDSYTQAEQGYATYSGTPSGYNSPSGSQDIPISGMEEGYDH